MELRKVTLGVLLLIGSQLAGVVVWAYSTFETKHYVKEIKEDNKEMIREIRDDVKEIDRKLDRYFLRHR